MFWFRKSKPARQGSVNGVVSLASGYNIRELGGYATPYGRTHTHRFLRSGGIDRLSADDARYLLNYGVGRICDLRGPLEVRGGDGPLQNAPQVKWVNVPLYDFDMSNEEVIPHDNVGGYLSDGYFTMLANRPAVRQVFEFFSEAPDDCCVLFHCAAGMDRTGVIAMLVLGLCGVGRDQIVADYAYSFGYLGEVNAAVFAGRGPLRHQVRADLQLRIDAISAVYDRLVQRYSSVEKYLLDCGLERSTLDAVSHHLLG